MGCRPCGVIFLSTYRLIGTDADVVFLIHAACAQSGDLLRGRTLGGSYRFCILEGLARRILDLITGNVAGLRPGYLNASRQVARLLDLRRLRIDGERGSQRSAVLCALEGDLYRMLANALAAGRIAYCIIARRNLLALGILNRDRRVFGLAAVCIRGLGQRYRLRCIDHRCALDCAADRALGDRLAVCTRLRLGCGRLVGMRQLGNRFGLSRAICLAVERYRCRVTLFALLGAGCRLRRLQRDETVLRLRVIACGALKGCHALSAAPRKGRRAIAVAGCLNRFCLGISISVAIKRHGRRVDDLAVCRAGPRVQPCIRSSRRVLRRCHT